MNALIRDHGTVLAPTAWRRAWRQPGEGSATPWSGVRSSVRPVMARRGPLAQVAIERGHRGGRPVDRQPAAPDRDTTEGLGSLEESDTPRERRGATSEDLGSGYQACTGAPC